MSKSTVFIITFLFIGTAVTLILSIVTGKEYNRSSLTKVLRMKKSIATLILEVQSLLVYFR